MGARIDCCSNATLLTPTANECIAVNDSDASGNHCSSYSRTAGTPRRRCELGAREQMNAATAFLDVSFVYGSSQEEAADLRTFEGGLLRTSAGDLLPIVGQENFDQNEQPTKQENPALGAVQTLLMRQHNRLAQQLARINPLWDDDTLYHEARRLVVAQVQHITYREYLPAVLGENLAENLRLTPQPSARFLDYDIDAYPGALQAASQAALSFSLAMLPAKFDTFTMVRILNSTRTAQFLFINF